MNRPEYPKIILLLLLFLGVLLSGSVAAESRIHELRIADSRGAFGLPNPFQHYPRGPGYLRMSWVFDSLIWKDAAGFVPALAERWSFDAKNNRYRFDLNPAARWHDGRPLTAADIVFTINYLKQHPYPWVSLQQIAKAEAIGQHRVDISLSQPYAPFLAEVAGTLPILPQHIWQNVAEPRQFTAAAAFIGSGPYRFSDFNKAQGSYLYTAFADYYQGAPRAVRLIYLRSSNPLASLMNGEADLASIKPEMVAPLRNKGLKIIKNERGWVRKLMINHSKAPLNDKAFRQALAYTINRQELIDKGQRGFATPASSGLLSVDHSLYNPQLPNYPHNLDKARQLLKSLGYQWNDAGFLTLRGAPVKLELLDSQITVAGGTADGRDGSIIKQQLTALGIQVDLRNLETTTSDSRIKAWNFDLALSGHGGIAGDARILNEMVLPNGGAGSVNSARYAANPELNRLLAEQLKEADPVVRKKLVARIQLLIAEELPALPLYYPETLSAYNPAKHIDWYYTPGGIGKGIPIPQNKQALIP